MSEAVKLDFKFACSIVVREGAHSKREFLFEQNPITIGRGVENLIVLSEDARVSRLHLELTVEKRGIWARNLSKTNQTFMGDREIHEELIPHECQLIIGESKLDITVRTDFSSLQQFISRELKSSTPKVSQREISPPSPAKINHLEPRRPHSADLKPQSSPRPISPPKSKVRQSSSKVGNKNQGYFYIVLIGILGLAVFLFSGNKNNKTVKPDLNKPRLSADAEIEIRSYEELMKEFEARREKIGTRNYQMAQENFLKGFRDYRQGQYGRAKEFFQVVINIDSENEMARRYYQLAKLKYDELIRFHMLQGKRYYEKKNWRLCRAGYFNAMTMLQNNQSDPLFKESERYYQACQAAMEGRF